MSSRRRNALGVKEVASVFVMLPLIGLVVGIALGGVRGGTLGLKVGFALAVALVVLTAIGEVAADAQARKRRNLIRPHSRTIPQDVKIAVSVRDNGKCRICGSTRDLQYDHIIPWSKGGRSDDPNNIQLLCGYHNRLKRDQVVSVNFCNLMVR